MPQLPQEMFAEMTDLVKFIIFCLQWMSSWPLKWRFGILLALEKCPWYVVKGKSKFQEFENHNPIFVLLGSVCIEK